MKRFRFTRFSQTSVLKERCGETTAILAHELRVAWKQLEDVLVPRLRLSVLERAHIN